MTNTFAFANFASTNLASAVSNIATSITVNSGTGAEFPALSAGQQFALILQPANGGSNREIVYVTEVLGDTFTVLRGQEGTTAQNWSVGDIAFCSVTAGALAAMVQSAVAVTLADIQAQVCNWAPDTGATNALQVALSPAPASLAALEGVPIRVLVGHTNTGAVTLKVGSLAAKPITAGGAALIPGQLPAGSFATMVYDGTGSFDLQSIIYPTFAGDGGAGGKAGLVPAPAAGSAALYETLLANGSFGMARSAGTFTVSGGVVNLGTNQNVASVVRNGTGNYTVHLTNPMPSVNFILKATAASNTLTSVSEDSGQPRTTSSFGLTCRGESNPVDPAALSFEITSTL